MTRLAIFASGNGTNAENIIRHFHASPIAEVVSVFTNNPRAGVLERAARHSAKTHVFSRKDFFDSNRVLTILIEEKIDFIVLAGFLWMVPATLIRHFEKRIINIHPALLPDFGGKGFYGDKVHQAVIDSGTPISGITIHHVNEQFDEGEIIFQAACHVDKTDTSSSLAAKIHELEQRYFAVVLEKLISGMLTWETQ